MKNDLNGYKWWEEKIVRDLIWISDDVNKVIE